MKSFARSCLLGLTFIASCSYAAAPDPSLAGCWRAVRIVVHAHNGSVAQDTSGRCTLRFQEDQYESACSTTTGARAVTTYRYEVVRPGVYETTMAGSTFRTDMVGSKREYEYHVEGDRLTTVAHPTAKEPPVPSSAARVETEAARIPCE